ncbi:MAG: oligosaccharide flippase family protein [Terracidiphilus sp.]
MRRQLSNTIYGLLDYGAYPIGMLAVAPVILRNLGVSQYGVWTVASSVVSFGSIVASGFGDANIQKVATQRGDGCRPQLLRVVRAAMGIHVVLGICMGLVIWAMAPMLADRIAGNDRQLIQTCFSCIRIAAVFVVIRAVETVCISTQRAFERYGAAVRISIAARFLGLAGAAILAMFTRSVVNIMALTAALAAVALVAQYIRLRQLLKANLLPSFDLEISRDLLQFGVFTWLSAAAGVVFSQGDRLIGGASMGASAVVAYALCAQISQPVYGLTASGLHFLFPYLAIRQRTSTPTELRRIVKRAFAANAVLVLIGTGTLLTGSNWILHLLANDAVASACALLLPSVLAGSALAALSVTGVYAMFALGRVQFVALTNVGGALAGAGVVAYFVHGFGVKAIIAGRFAFALVALLVYVPLLRELRIGSIRVDGLAANGPAVEEA